MKVEYIDAVIKAMDSIVKSFGITTVQTGKLRLAAAEFTGEDLLVAVGLTGDLQGQVLLKMDVATACALASKMMMGMEVTELNAMAQSAVGELANMTMGTATTHLALLGKVVDITPPSVIVGTNLRFSVADARTICVPLLLDAMTVELNIAFKER